MTVNMFYDAICVCLGESVCGGLYMWLMTMLRFERRLNVV